MEKLQEQIDSLIAEHGIHAVIEGVKKHLIHPDVGGGCPTGYYLNSQGVCVPDIGG